MVKKTITITKEQEKFIREETLDLSAFVQKKLNEKITESGSQKEHGENKEGGNIT
jgi:hypothetical protein